MNNRFNPFEYYVNSVPDLIQCVEHLIGVWGDRFNTNREVAGIVSRGCSDHTFDLNPSFLRDHTLDFSNVKMIANIERNLIDNVIRKAPIIIDRLFVDRWDALFMMQHYRLPTRLLDWTNHLLVSAYFACKDFLISDQDGAIWILVTAHLCDLHGDSTNLFLTRDSQANMMLPNSSEDVLIISKLPPLPLLPPIVDKRIFVQHSVFTIHPYKQYALEELAEEDRLANGNKCFLQKIRIPASSKSRFYNELNNLFGINEEFLFPDMEGLSRAKQLEKEFRHPKPEG